MKSLMFILFSTVLVLALSLAMAWPLWSLATKGRLAYTVAVGVAVVLTSAFLIVRGQLRRRAAIRGRKRRPGA